MVEDDEQMLPQEISDQLVQPLRESLNHPVRRQILRVLNLQIDPLTPLEILSMVPKATPDAINYHLGILRDSDSVFVVGEQVPSSSALGYVSAVADNEAVRVALIATRDLDAL